MPTFPAQKPSLVYHFNFSTFNLQSLPVNQGVSDFPVRRLDDAAERGSGDAHPLRGIFLIEALEIG